MRKVILLIVISIVVFGGSLFSQNVGIGTTSPTNTLHVLVDPTNPNPNPVRFEGIQRYTTEDSVLVVNPSTGVVKYMPMADVLANIPPNVLDSLILNSVINNTDTIYNNQSVRDSIIAIALGNADTLFSTQIFRDSVLGVILSNMDTIFTITRDSLLNDSTFINTLRDSIDTDIDSVTFANDTIYIYENGTTVQTYINTSLDTALVDSLILASSDTLYTIISDSLTKDTNWIKQIDSLLSIYGDTIYFNDSTYTLIKDSLLNDTAWLSELQDSINTDDQNIDSLTITGTILTTYIEDGTSASIDVSNMLDSVILSKSDTLYSIISDSLTKDSLWIKQIDSLLSIYGDTIYFNDTSYTLIRDSLLNDSLFLDSLVSLIGDSINTDDQNIDSLILTGTILTTYIEDGTSASIDVSNMLDSVILSKSDTLYSIISDSLAKDSLWIKQIDSLLSIYGDTIYFNDTSYTLIRDSLLNDSLFLDSLVSLIGDSINTDDQNIDSLILTGTILTTHIEDGTSASIDVSNMLDSVILSKSDTLYSIISDSLTKDSLWIKQIDSLLSIYGDTIYFNDTSYTLIRDSLLNDSLFLDSLVSLIGDSINTDDQNIDSLTLTGTILTTHIEDGASATIDLQPIIDSAVANSNDPTAWKLTGNAGTTAGTNFLGTTDNQDLVFKRNNINSGRISTTNTSFGLNSNNSNGGVGNTSIGSGSLRNNTTGPRNTAIGVDVMQSNTTGDGNTSIGYWSLYNNTTGNQNVALGDFALSNNTTASQNTAIGHNSLLLNTASNNTALGNHSLAANTLGAANTALGDFALRNNTTGSQNTANGRQALNSNTIGNNNLASGVQALFSNISGGQNTANGHGALRENISGNNNVANGFQANYSNTIGFENTSIGYRSLHSNTIGSSNIGSGSNALYSNVAGSNAVAIGANSQQYANNTTTAYTNQNTSIGYSALRGSTTASANTGNSNTAIGYESMMNNTTGHSNVTNGYRSLYSNTIGISNTANGHSALYLNTTGHNNTSLGTNSGYSITTGTFNTFLGAGANATSGILTNATAVGANALVSQSNTLILGGTGIYDVNVGIGTVAPYTKLTVIGKSGNNVLEGTSFDLIAGFQESVGGGGLAISTHPTTQDVLLVPGKDNTDMIFGSNTGSSGHNESMRIMSTGNVGINTSLATNQLHIAGGTDPLRLEGLQYGGTTDSVLVTDANGVVKLSSASSVSTVAGIRTETANYAIVSIDATILVDASASAVTVTLPSAVANAGKKYVIKAIDVTNAIVLNSAAGLIDGVASQNLNILWQGLEVQSNGTDWFIIGRP